MKYSAVILLFTSALALAAPAEDVAGVEDVATTPAEDITDGDFFANEIARGASQPHNLVYALKLTLTDLGQPCNVSTNVRPNRVVCPGAH
ncbi:hypothetical protein QQS21_008852 [Conoideocrella luteorostrata]|uniref:Uncharacterized protein n=1 Tax=Conoideocrella luteorostrata TaxID=1105319 RepID=A0AAJ0CI18_9HYPO|nr:hypothetical protein QQS21_008852 [Conoideocrella luteorostrata]